jgi:type I restriction enzyme M protein
MSQKSRKDVIKDSIKDSGYYAQMSTWNRASYSMKQGYAQGYVLTPGSNVGTSEVEEDEEPFEQKMERFTIELESQFEKSGILEQKIRANLKLVGNPFNRKGGGA